MKFLLNDLSFHGQFHSLNAFEAAIGQLMRMRETAHSLGLELHCHRDLVQANVMANMTMQQAVAGFTKDKQRSILSWMTKSGPFWQDVQEHSSDEWLEHDGRIVTGNAIGEVAWLQMQGLGVCGLVSLSPSNWGFSPVLVDWCTGDDSRKTIQVVNYWDCNVFRLALEQAPSPLESWLDLKQRAVDQCKNLTFSDDAFEPLSNIPFVRSAAEGLLSLVLAKLDRFKVCFNEQGQRTSEGDQIYQDFFTGSKGNGGRGARFSDSSESEKRDFKKEMTFKHPADETKKLFCPWHGKVQTPQLRVHFSYPVRANEPLYIVHVGPKITKR